MVLSHWYYYIPSVLSSDSAVGIIIAQGNELYEDGTLNRTECIIYYYTANKLKLRYQTQHT